MYRIEIIANKSVEEDITENLEAGIPEIMYTKIPLAYGKGKKNRKEGTATWPETNFVLISYIPDNHLDTARKIIEAIKNKFKGEGIKIFTVKCED